MRRADQGRILITGSIAGFTPGSFQAVYNATKSYLNSLLLSLREGIAQRTKVSVTCLMPGATETEFFARADMLDTKVGSEEKDDAAMGRQNRIRGVDERLGRRCQRMEEKNTIFCRQCDAGRVVGQATPQMAEPGTAEP